MKVLWHAVVAALAVMILTPALRGDGVKYVFLLIGDGYGANQRQVAETLAGGKLAMSGLSRTLFTGTANAHGEVTDSAASGTAIACGVKTYNGAIGVDLDGRPVESLAMKLQKRGFKVGLISSSPLTDATPAAHYAHQNKRSMRKEIGLELARSGVAFAGGAGVHDKTTYDDLRAAGWEVHEGSNGLARARAGVPTFVNAAPFTPWSPGETNGLPTLADYLRKAIGLLDGPQGFFIMLENGQIDYSGHSNDADKMWREVLAFDEAVKVALAFQKGRPAETVVVVTADHETGGLQIDAADRDRLQILRHQKAAKNDIHWVKALYAAKERETEDAQVGALIGALQDGLGIAFTAADVAKLDKPARKALATGEPREKALNAGSPKGTLVPLLSAAFAMRDERAGIRYTTTGHSLARVITNVQGPGTENFEDPMENSDIPHLLQAIVAPDIGDAAYQDERRGRVAFSRKLAPYRSLPAADPRILRPMLLPVATHISRIGAVSYNVSLPDWDKFVESSVHAAGDEYYIELMNKHGNLPLLGTFVISNAAATTRFRIFDPVSDTAWCRDDGAATWSAAEIAATFRALCPAGGGAMRIVCSSREPSAAPAALRKVSEEVAAYNAVVKEPLYMGARPAAAAPVVDGDLGDASWAAARIHSFVDIKGNPLTNGASARFATDSAHSTLFIALSAPDRELIANSEARDTAQYDDDCFEIFLGDASSDLYYHVVVNPAGSIYDARQGDKQWNGDMTVKTAADAQKGLWTAELAIPLAQFGFGGPIAGNICHTDQPGARRGNLFPTGGDFHKALNFVPVLLLP